MLEFPPQMLHTASLIQQIYTQIIIIIIKTKTVYSTAALRMGFMTHQEKCVTEKMA